MEPKIDLIDTVLEDPIPEVWKEFISQTSQANMRLAPTPNLQILADRNVVITGGASGIGEGFARALGAAGAYVTIADRNVDRGLSIESELRQKGQKVRFCEVDVTSWDSQVALFKSALAFSPYQSIDIVIPSAGIVGYPFLSKDQEPSLDVDPVCPFTKIIPTNVTGVFYTAYLGIYYFRALEASSPTDDEVLPSFQRTIMFVNSFAAYEALNGWPLYTMAHFAIRGLFKSMRELVRRWNIRMISLAPSFVRTGVASPVNARLAELGVGMVDLDDVVQAMLRILTDQKQSGRAYGIKPSSKGHPTVVDLQDDYLGFEGGLESLKFLTSGFLGPAPANDACSDFAGKEDPSRIWASVPLSTNISDGFRDLPLRQLVTAVDSLSWSFASLIGRSSTFETVAYLGLPDLRYNLVALALIKTGHKMLSMSERNSIAWHNALMDSVRVFLDFNFSTEGLDVQDLLNSRKMIAFQVAKLEEMLSPTTVVPFPYEKTWAESKNDPTIVVHTSGSTGVPRPITWNHNLGATIAAHMRPPPLDGRENVYEAMRQSERQYVTMPFAHSSSLLRLFRSLLLGVTLVTGPVIHIGTSPESINIVKQVLRYGKVDGAHFLPGTLEALCDDDQALVLLSKLKLIGWGGGPLGKAAGDKLAKVCRDTYLYNSLGSSDGGAYVMYRTDSEDWDYNCFCPHFNGIEWHERETDLYEMVVVRKPELAPYQGVFKMVPFADKWPTKDLFSKHPTKANHWRHEARLDDLVILGNGAKFNPLSTEALMLTHPVVRSAMMVGGTGRFRPALMIELDRASPAYTTDESTFATIWEVVSKNNEVTPRHGRIIKSLIYILPLDKHFLETNKGTIQRANMMKLFQSELDDLYAAAGSEASNGY